MSPTLENDIANASGEIILSDQEARQIRRALQRATIICYSEGHGNAGIETDACAATLASGCARRIWTPCIEVISMSYEPADETPAADFEPEPEDGQHFVPGLFFLAMCLEIGHASCVTAEPPEANQ